MKSALLWLLMIALCAAQELPTRMPGEPMDFEPSLRLYEIPEEQSAQTEKWAVPPDVQKAQAAAEQARAKAQRWQVLQKRGVLSKVEAEKATVQANRAVLRFQQARVASLRQQIASLKQRGGTQDMIVSAEAALASAERLRVEAEQTAWLIDLEFAETNLQRMRSLAKAGLTPRSQVKQAEALVAHLRAQRKR
jgi:multidrug resistance efflux pump